MERFGAFIREKRPGRGYPTAKAFAEAVPMDPSTLSRLERGEVKTLPEAAQLSRIAELLGVTNEYLLTLAGYLPPSEPGETQSKVFANDPFRRRIVELLATTQIELPQLASLAEIVIALGLRYEQQHSIESGSIS